MLTFEEFFQKKKINLLQFQQHEPVLFAEFSSHYPLMGEKSFDHTKKYHFNNLRRNYPLPVLAKQHPVMAEAISNLAAQGIAVAAAQNLDESIERPKFKEDHLVELSVGNVTEKDISLAAAEQVILETKPEIEVSKPAFKPRFNPKNIPKTAEEPTPDVTADQIEPTVKPAFKPRFNSKIIPKTEKSEFSVPEADEQTLETESAKTAYKPKFNTQNIKKDVVKTVSDANQDLQNGADGDYNTPQTAANQPAFKPNVNHNNASKPNPELIQENVMHNLEDVGENIGSKPDLDTQDTENLPIKTVSANEAVKSEINPDPSKPEKAVYKPRFQAKNIPKPPQV